MKNRKFTEQQLREAVETSSSKRAVLKKLGLVEAGGNYQCLQKAITQLNLDTSHFKGAGWNKGMKFQPKRPVEDYLTGKAEIQTFKLKNRLFAEGIFEAKCYSCGLRTWLGKPAPLELEHINGDVRDNSLSNLTILCPNCHAFTPTYRGKNKKKA